jgi:dUTP pyrophosphatase
MNNTSHDKIMHLSIFVDSDDAILKQLYLEACSKHNNKLIEEPHFYDAGFDLFLPKNETEDEDNFGFGTRFFGKGFFYGKVPMNKIDFKVKCCAKIYDKKSNFYYSPFYTYMRSSMSKTPLRLANNQGIIDAGYRGNLIGMFDCIYEADSDEEENVKEDWYMDVYSRILQICAPGLIPIFVNVVDKLEDLGPNTSRGEGGFGSTGK